VSLKFIKFNRDFPLMSDKSYDIFQGRIIDVPLCGNTHLFKSASIFHSCRVFSSSGIGKPTGKKKHLIQRTIISQLGCRKIIVKRLDIVILKDFRSFRFCSCSSVLDKSPQIKLTSLTDSSTVQTPNS